MAYRAREIACEVCGQPYLQKKAANRMHVACVGEDRRRKLSGLLAPVGGFAVDAPAPPPMKHPTGWEPHVEENGDRATAVSRPMETASPDEDTLIRGWNLDPTEWQIDGPLNCRRWQAVVPEKNAEGRTIGYTERWLFYYKASLRRRSAAIVGADVAAMVEEIKTHARIRVKKASEGTRALAVCLSDAQVGKADGDGTEGIVGRWLDKMGDVTQRVADLRRINRRIDSLYVLGLGDIIENCDNFYAQQAWRTQLNRREQVNIARRLIVRSLQEWAPQFSRVVVACVGGNHGENRKDGKSFTDFADNDDVAVFEQAQEILAANPGAYKHVSFQIPNDRLDLTLDIHGTITGLTHGHQAGKGPTAQVKLHNWWRDQAHGQRPIGNASLLLSGHYHHFSIVELGAKTHIQAPSLDGGSDWFTNTNGVTARPGMLTCIVGNGSYSDVEVL